MAQSGLVMPALAAAIGLFASAGAPVAAAPCTPESEPNSEFAELISPPVTGALCISGVAEKSDQDLVLWSVPPEDANVLWRFVVEGLPGEGGLIGLAKPAPPADDGGMLGPQLPFDASTSPTMLWQQTFDASSSVATSPWVLLRPGPYIMAISPKGLSLVWRLKAERAASLPATLAPGETMSGAFERSLVSTGSELRVPWTVNEPDTATCWAIALKAPLKAYGTLTLEREGWDPRPYASLADPDGSFRLGDLDLPAGDYTLVVGGTEKDTPLILSATAGETKSPGFAGEPDDTIAASQPIRFGETRRGRLDASGGGSDTDYFALDIDEASAKRRFDVIFRSEAKATVILELIGPEGRSLVSRLGVNEVALRGLSLAPGRYHIAAKGALPADRDYRLSVEDRGEAAEVGEREPNDMPLMAPRIEASTTLHGSFDGSDTDYIRLHVEGGLRLWSFEAAGPGLNRLTLYDSTGSAATQANRAEGTTRLRLSRVLLAPGDHLIRLDGDGGSWIARSAELGAPKPGEEIEPNDTARDALDLRFGEPNLFWLDASGDIDIYTFRIAATHFARVEILAPPGAAASAQLAQDAPFGSGPALESAGAADGRGRYVWSGNLIPGDYFLSVRTYGELESAPFALNASLHPPISAPAEESPVDASLAIAASEIAAYAARQQRVGATLTLKNTGAAPVTMTLLFWAGDERWQAEGLPAEATLQAGESRDVHFSIMAAPDAADVRPIGVAVAARREDQTLALATGEIAPRIAGVLTNPAIAPMPAAGLEGGLDLAWTALGATAADDMRGLFDGQLDGSPVTLNKDEPVTVDLAGESAAPVAGFVLVPPSASGTGERLHRFRIELSQDGASFDDVFEGELSPSPREQAFVLPAPVSATHARLTALDNWSGTEGGAIRLSEFKVIGTPGRAPMDADIAREDLGGHIVWTAPKSDPPVTGEGAALNEGYGAWFVSDVPRAAAWVMGFKDNRAARIKRVVISLDPATPASERIASLRVETSTAGPFGPFEPAGELTFTPETPDAALDLDAARWARYVRFSVLDPVAKRIGLPKSVAVIEADGGGYRSILGEWGAFSNRGPFEAEQVAAAARPEAPGGGKDRESAKELAPGVEISGSVARGRNDDWFRIEAPGDARAIELQLGGFPSIDAGFEIVDAAGTSLTLAPGGEYGRYTAELKSPGTHDIRIFQPERSAVIAWDTSMSVGPFVPAIVRVVRRLADDLAEGDEAINFLPFRGDGTRLLLPGFASSRAASWAAIHGYDWSDSDSNAERAVLVATQGLATRQGARSIVLITDASSGGADLNAELWSALETVRPHVYALHIPTASRDARALRQTALMLDWASINDGFYSVLASPAEAELAFRRIAARLKEPAAYTLSYTWRAKPLEPGRISVAPDMREAASSSAASPPAIALVLDASGSMLKRLGRQRKIETAKAILTRIVKERLPESVQLSLRVFGQGGRGSCNSDLVVPPQSLDRAAAAAAIRKIVSTDGAKTPIAESLKLAAQDLGGRGLIVLLTDGEETCGGDPKSEIDALRAQGLDVRFNIVGFDVEEAGVETQFRAWAEAGAGRYFDAADAEALEAALAASLAVPFRVLSASGETVATGAVGTDAIEVPPGVYRVIVDGETPVTFDTVGVEPGGETVLTLR